MKSKVLVVDLDGTLYSINTFHFFIKFLVYNSIKKLDVSLFFFLLIALFLRGSKIVSHSKMKYLILRTIEKRKYMDYDIFVKSISKYKREIKIINNKDFDLKILATAAPTCYAVIIAENEGFNKCLATDFPKSSFKATFENSNVNKKENVLNYLRSEGVYEIDTLVTDHLDDFPLIKLAKTNIIVNPDESFRVKLKQNLISFEVIS